MSIFFSNIIILQFKGHEMPGGGKYNKQADNSIPTARGGKPT